MDAPIDAVITWVDGNDPKFLEKKRRFSPNANAYKDANNATRFNEVGELEIVIKSIFKYAPFIRRIYIVSDDQVPPVMQKANSWHPYYREKLKLIDHRDIFVDHLDVLPTFSPLTIETLLFKIPDLSEHFICFNDDFFLVKPTQKTDWFKDGLPLVRGRWFPLPDRVWYKKLKRFLFPWTKALFSFRRTQALSAQLIGYNKNYFRLYHTPRPFLKSHFETYFNENPEKLVQQIQARFRSPLQFYPYSLIYHKAIQANQAITTNELRLVEVNFSEGENPSKIFRRIRRARSSDVLFLNLQSLDLVPKKASEKIMKILHEITEIDLYHLPPGAK